MSSATASEQVAQQEAVRVRQWRRWLLPALIAVLLAGTVGFQLLASSARGGAGLDDKALLDTQATSTVVGDVSDALSQVLSYQPTTVGQTAQAAQNYLTGSALTQYRTLVAELQQRAPQQHLGLTTHVVRAGVVSLHGTSAHLLVFLDQTAATDGKAQSTVPAQLAIGATLRGGHWLIDDIHSL